MTKIEEAILKELQAIEYDLDNINKFLKYIIVAGFFLILGGIII